VFGVAIVNSAGTQVPVRHVGEQHVKEDLGRIPTAQDWLLQITPVSRAIEDRGKSLGSNPDSRCECSAQGIGANAVSGTWPAATRGCFEQSWTRSSNSDSPLLATQFACPSEQSGDSQKSRARIGKSS
jgi:hypothetical protein